MKNILKVKKLLSVLLVGVMVAAGSSIGAKADYEEEEDQGERVYMTIITVYPYRGEEYTVCEWRYEGEVINDTLEDENEDEEQTVLYEGEPVNGDLSFGEIDLTKPFIRVIGVAPNEDEKLLSDVYNAVKNNHVSFPVNIVNHSKGTEREFTSWRRKEENVLDYMEDWYSDVGEEEDIFTCETSSGKPVDGSENCKDLAEYFDSHPGETLVVHKNV